MTLPPHNLEAEEFVIGGLILEPGRMPEVVDVVKPGDCYSERHRLVFEAMMRLVDAGRPIDFVTVADELGDHLDKIGGASWVSSLADRIPTTANIIEHARMVRNHAVCRRAIRKCDDIKKLLSSPSEADNPDAVLDLAQRELMSLVIGESASLYDARQVAHESMKQCKTIYEGGAVVGVPTGIRGIDKYLGGGFQADLIIIAARPSHGKTALACSMTANQCEMGKHVGYVAIEPNRLEIHHRLISMRGQINLIKFRNGLFKPEDWASVVMWQDAISRWPLHIDDAHVGLPVDEIMRKCRRLRREGCEVIYIDQLSKIRGEGRGLYEQYTHIVNRIAELPKELGIPVVLLCQINREASKDSDKQPRLHHLKQTGSIEEDARVVLLLYRQFLYTSEPKHEFVGLVDIAKQTMGPIGEVDVRWAPKYAHFEDM